MSDPNNVGLRLVDLLEDPPKYNRTSDFRKRKPIGRGERSDILYAFQRLLKMQEIEGDLYEDREILEERVETSLQKREALHHATTDTTTSPRKTATPLTAKNFIDDVLLKSDKLLRPEYLCVIDDISTPENSILRHYHPANFIDFIAGVGMALESYKNEGDSKDSPKAPAINYAKRRKSLLTYMIVKATQLNSHDFPQFLGMNKKIEALQQAITFALNDCETPHWQEIARCAEDICKSAPNTDRGLTLKHDNHETSPNTKLADYIRWYSYIDVDDARRDELCKTLNVVDVSLETYLRGQVTAGSFSRFLDALALPHEVAKGCAERWMKTENGQRCRTGDLQEYQALCSQYGISAEATATTDTGIHNTQITLGAKLPESRIPHKGRHAGHDLSK